MRRKLQAVGLVLILVVSLAGCASFMAAWQGLTPDQKARVIVDEFQTELGNYFDMSKAYVDAHPEYLDKWKMEIVPAFDLANLAIKNVIELGKVQEITPDEVRSRLLPYINKVVTHLVKIGAFQ